MIRSLRVLAPAAVTLFAVVGALLGQQSAGRTALGLALALGAAGLAAWRRLTGWSLVVALAAAATGYWVLCHGHPANLGLFGLSVLAGWVATVARPRQTVVLVVAVFALTLAEFAQDTTEPGWFAWSAGAVFAATACTQGRRQRDLLDQLREAQAGLADRARVEERNRIAGELHDVIGHALTVSLLHVGTARLAVEEGATDEALTALDQAEAQSRRSLEEIRSSVGVLRASEGARAPLPGGADLPALVDSFRGTGTPVECALRGDLATLPTATGLAAYRIVQEALTNVARHAAGSAAEVSVDIADGQARLVVASAGRPGPRTSGTGLVGMRERAESVGGRLTAGPAGTGWRVEAVLPA